MKLVLLGTGGYFPTSRRQTSCFYLPEHGLALDAGTGLARVGRYPLREQLDILLTHGHQDHSIGLLYLPGTLRNSDVETVCLWGSKNSTEEIVRRLFGEPLFSRTIDNLPYSTRILSLPGRLELGDLTIVSEPMPHGLHGSLAFRLTDRDGVSVVLITDTHVTASQATFCQGADLLLADCYFRSDQEDKAAATAHSTPVIIAQLAKAAEVKRLVLVHVNPAETEPERLVEEAQRVFPHTLLGEDEMELEVGGNAQGDVSTP